MHVGTDPALGAEVAGHQLGGVVRRVRDLPEVGVRFIGRVAVVAVVGALPAVEVLVDTGAGKAVEAGDRCRQVRGWQTGLAGEFLDGLRFDDDAGIEPLPRDPLARLQTREDIAVPVTLIEDQPGRDVLAGAGSLTVVAAVHVVAGLDVGHRLVHEPLARHVDDHRSRRVTFGQGEPRRTLQRHRRSPPRVLHQIHCRAEFLGCQDAVSGVGDRTDRPLGADRFTLVLTPHRLVVLKTAAAENDSAPGPDQPRLGRLGCGHVPHIDSADHAALDVQVGQRSVQQYRHPGVAQTYPQRGDQRPAHPDQVLAAHPGPHGTGADFETAQHAAGVALHLVEADIVLLHHHDVERNLAVRRFQAGHIRAESFGVERFRLDRAAGGAPAGLFGVVVGVAGHPAHLQWGVLEHEGQHLRPTLQIGVDLLGRDDVTDDGVQVGAGSIGGVGDTVALEDLVIGDPHPAPGAGCRAAEVRGLFQDYRRKSLMGGGEGGDHAGRAAPDHNDVELLSSHTRTRYRIGPCGR